jgi:protein-tyrosine-phosphatase
MAKLILTVCKGNIERSVLAALCIERELAKLPDSETFAVESRGIHGMAGEPLSQYPNLMLYEDVWPLAVPAFAKYGIKWPRDKRSTPMTREAAIEASVIYAMDRKVLEKLHAVFPALTHKIKLFGELTGNAVDVGDPYDMNTPEGHLSVVSFIDSTVRKHIRDVLTHCA